MRFVLKNGHFCIKDQNPHSSSTNASATEQLDLESFFERLTQHMAARLTLFEQRMDERIVLLEENMVQQFHFSNTQFNGIQSLLQELSEKCSSMGSSESHSAQGFDGSSHGQSQMGSQSEHIQDFIGSNSTVGLTAPDLRFTQPVPIPSISDDYVSNLLHIPQSFSSHPNNDDFFF